MKAGVLAVILTAIVCGLYFLAKRISHDRDAAMAYHERPLRHIDASASGTRTVKTYNSKGELEEAHKKGDVAAGAASVQSNSMNDAVQRNLRTLDEINRMNQMNQRLMEQQERMRRQTKN